MEMHQSILLEAKGMRHELINFTHTTGRSACSHEGMDQSGGRLEARYASYKGGGRLESSHPQDKGLWHLEVIFPIEEF